MSWHSLGESANLWWTGRPRRSYLTLAVTPGVYPRSVTDPLRTIDAPTARRFLVTRQLLATPRSQPPGPEGVLGVVRRLGSVQFDPLAVAGRNHDLVLEARVRDYEPAW